MAGTEKTDIHSVQLEQQLTHTHIAILGIM